ncbi:MAG: pantoate--beta-alanine ligase [Acidimicrobiales bacterium]
MDLIETTAGLRTALGTARAKGRTVGLVPTMGAFHEGHLSLMRRAVAECDVVAVTVFVNPLQFGAGEDLDLYPRDLESDAVKAAAAGVDVLFAPTGKEMFPTPPLTTVTVGGLSEGREGASRPGHFAGVATIVAKLFALAGPCRAYFGEKDYQQLEVVRRMVADLSVPVDVVACPTVREADGLALSSRNAYLSPVERAAATVVYRALVAGRDLAAAGVTDPTALGRAMADVVASEPLAGLDYAEAVAGPGGALRLYVAARVGATRLIDNLEVPTS